MTKNSGHCDQLSFTTPALDRFRIVALLEHFSSGRLSADERSKVEEVIREKSRIVASGAAKRGEVGRAKFYAKLSKADLTGYGQALDPVVSEAWEAALAPSCQESDGVER